MDTLLHILKEVLVGSWSTLTEMAPYLLFGFLIAGLLSVLISQSLVERHLGGKGLWQVIKASALGVPLPLCSCGVIPVAASLRRHGAGKGATVSFLISTPQTGVDSIMVTYSMLGLIFAIFRPVVALINGIIGGVVTILFEKDDSQKNKAEIKCDAPCCNSEYKGNKMTQAIKYGFVSLSEDIAKALFIGILLAGVIETIIPENYLAGIVGSGVLGILIMMLMGIPVYVCATASVPIAAVLISKGVSPGAAFAFLMTGPATNAATIATIWKILGRKTAIIYLATVAATAFVSGLVLDYVFRVTGTAKLTHEHQMIPEYAKIICAIVLIVVLAVAIFRKYFGAKALDVAIPGAETYEISIYGMHCNHCVKAINTALIEISGVEHVGVSLKDKKAIVKGEDVDNDLIKKAVEELGYSVINIK